MTYLIFAIVAIGLIAIVGLRHQKHWRRLVMGIVALGFFLWVVVLCLLTFATTLEPYYERSGREYVLSAAEHSKPMTLRHRLSIM